MPIYSNENFGAILNVATSDVELVEYFTFYIVLPTIPTGILFALLFFIPFIGWVCTIIVAMCLLFILVGFSTSPIIVRLRNEIAAKTDKRNSMLANILEGIRVIKISTLERIFLEEMNEIRREEISKYRSLALAKSIPYSTYLNSIGIITFVPLLLYVVAVGPVTLDIAVAFLSFSSVAQMWITGMPSFYIPIVSVLLAGFNRLTSVLVLPEIQQLEADPTEEPSNKGTIELENISASLTKKSQNDEVNSTD
jgi:ABC-type bacteriocin/lantibiotic exporter with double-glycine peptidase domain